MAEILGARTHAHARTHTHAHFQLHTRPPGSVVIADDYLSMQTTESLEDVNTRTHSLARAHTHIL